MTKKTVALKQAVLIPASPAAVYRAYTDPKEHSAFTGAEATGEPKVGGAFTAWGGYIEGEYLELVPNERVVQAWSTSEWPAGYAPSRLELTFLPDGDGTKVSLLQTEVPAEQADDYESGWHSSYWEPLTDYFEEQGK